MKSNAFNLGMPQHWLPPKLLLIMKMIIIIMTMCLLQVNAASFGQRVTISEKNISLKKVFKEIRNQTGYDFMYDAEIMKSAQPIDVELKNSSLTDALLTCLSGQNLTFEIKDKSIIIKNRAPELVLVQQLSVSGIVLDENNIPIPGASIKIKGNLSRGTVSNKEGRFLIVATSENDVLIISYIGYQSQEIKVKGAKSSLTIKLKVEETNMKDVIITGMMTRKKETFTGATASFSGEELKAIGNVNVIQSLRTLDPSFLLMENNMAGANPNVLPTIELRGRTSITTDGLRDEFSNDPNQPLFILDGFETNLRTIVDLDVNRVASITLLKDAASTAIYGSRASNGVVVIETVQPKPGELTVNYTTDGNVEIPDLSSYNMMNAAEKLEFERLSGRYTTHIRFDNPIDQMYLDDLYSKRLQSVNRGVNSYWLNEPLQTGFSQRHSLMVNGGGGAVTFGFGGDYRYTNGVMKGSGRKTWGTRLNLTYRNKNFNASNSLYINGYKSDESNYGNFSTWVNVNPYYEKVDGTERYLEVLENPYTLTTERNVNPFYAVGLNNFDKSRNYSITNNLQLRYDLSSSFRLSSSLQVTESNIKSQTFYSPLDNKFVETPVLERGTLNSISSDNFGYTANIALNYGKTLGKHLINGLIRAEVSDRTTSREGFLAVGFPSTSNGNARFAYGFAEGGAPIASKSISRRNSLVSSFNYSYDRRYNFDASFTYDGSTSFGKNNLYSPFYVFGGSWNLNNEAFLKDNEQINLLRLRANVGITGNQNFSSFTSVTTYSYEPAFNYSGQGIYLSSLGNQDLKWQSTVQTSLGLDLAMYNNRFTAQFNAYRKHTDPLVIAITLPPSTALNNYPLNAGTLTVQGLEAILKFSPIYRVSDRIVWTLGLTGSTYKQRYNNFNNILESLNENLRKSNSFVKYRDGGDPNDIWTVPSLGIDPATGKEIFLKKDGSYTYEYDYKDQVVVGNTRPNIEGVFNSNLSIKGFSLGLNFRYIVGQDIFNSALFNKVENISMQSLLKNNQDKRALYDRWKKVGDLAEFKSISITDYYAYAGVITPTEMSSRFIQREHSITLESASLGYEFRDFGWLKAARLSNLKLTGYANDIFRLSTVKRERGIEYPFSKIVSFSLSANFK